MRESFKTLFEAKFRKSKHLIHLYDVPMFSVFIDKEYAKAYPKDLQYIQGGAGAELVKHALEVARNEISRVGFPSMHSNIVISDHRLETNYNTGIFGGVGGSANQSRRYMTIDIRNVLVANVNDATRRIVRVVVHEWAHLWLEGKSSEFSRAVTNLYELVLRHAKNAMEPDKRDAAFKNYYEKAAEGKIDERTLSFMIKVDLYEGIFDKTMLYLLLSRTNITPSMIKSTSFPKFSIIVPLKRDVVNYYKPDQIVRKGTNVLLLKDTREPLVIKHNAEEIEFIDPSKIEDYFDMDELSRAMNTQARNILDGEEVTKKIKNKFNTILRGRFRLIVKDTFGYDLTEKDQYYITDNVNKWVETKIYPNILPLIYNNEAIEKLFTTSSMGKWGKLAMDILWPNGMADDVIPMLRELYRKKISQRDPLSYGHLIGKDFQELRALAASVEKWPSFYGMSNSDELWATAIENFFELPLKYRKHIISIMLR